MKRPLLVSIILLFLLPTGCMIGPSIHNARQARNPTGVRSVLTLAKHTIDGELIALQVDGLVILSHEELSLVQFGLIQSGRFSGSGAPRITSGRWPDRDEFERLRQLSRYPHGLSEEVLQRLLAEYDQDELMVVQ